jgi:hypothetical protein
MMVLEKISFIVAGNNLFFVMNLSSKIMLPLVLYVENGKLKRF